MESTEACPKRMTKNIKTRMIHEINDTVCVNMRRKKEELSLDTEAFPYGKFEDHRIILDLKHFREGKEVKYLGTLEGLEQKSYVSVTRRGRLTGTTHTYRILHIEYLRKQVCLYI